MGLFFWKKNKLIDTFAAELASEFYSTMKPETVEAFFEGGKDKKQARKSKKSMDNNLAGMTKKIQQFKAVNSLGVYGKARLHMKFRERLDELGYDKVLVNKINEIIMLRTP